MGGREGESIFKKGKSEKYKLESEVNAVDISLAGAETKAGYKLVNVLQDRRVTSGGNIKTSSQ